MYLFYRGSQRLVTAAMANVFTYLLTYLW